MGSNWLSAMLLYGMVLLFIVYTVLHAVWPRSGTPNFSDITLGILYILGLYGWPMVIFAFLYKRARHKKPLQSRSNFEPNIQPVIHTDHSEIRKNERGIPEYEIARTINYPHQQITTDNQRYLSFRHVENAPDPLNPYLVVVHTAENVIVTAFWANPTDLKRKGFKPSEDGFSFYR